MYVIFVNFSLKLSRTSPCAKLDVSVNMIKVCYWHLPFAANLGTKDMIDEEVENAEKERGVDSSSDDKNIWVLAPCCLLSQWNPVIQKHPFEFFN